MTDLFEQHAPGRTFKAECPCGMTLEWAEREALSTRLLGDGRVESDMQCGDCRTINRSVVDG